MIGKLYEKNSKQFAVMDGQQRGRKAALKGDICWTKEAYFSDEENADLFSTIVVVVPPATS